MLSRSRSSHMAGYAIMRTGGARPHVGKLPYYMAEVPGNPYAFFNHDGTTGEHLKGFTAKKIHWLQRFRHNLNPRCTAVGAFAFNIWGKNVHWLENKTRTKIYNQFMSEECICHTGMWIGVGLYVILHTIRYLLGHPDISLFNLALWTTKPLVDACRWEKFHPMDKPVFRYFQGETEYYMYSAYRQLVRAGVVANDPWLEYLKETDQLDKALLNINEFSGPALYPRPVAPPAHH